MEVCFMGADFNQPQYAGSNFMKICLITALLIASAVLTARAETFTAPSPKTKAHARPAAPISKKVEVDGVVPRAIRGGNPLQMFNPKAPRKYGTSLEAITYDQDDPNKIGRASR